MSLQSSQYATVLSKTREELNERIDAITKFTSRPYFNKALKKLALEYLDNATIICNYINAEQNEINIKPSTIEGKIKILIWLSNFHHGKSFNLLTKQDVLSYLSSLRNPIDKDPTQRWIGSFNGRQMILLKFFKWLYNSDEIDQKQRLTPPCMKGIKKLQRKQKTPYRHTDIWDAREHAIFLNYCPDTRDKCYHAMANDMSARPKEILNLRISDIKFKITKEGNQYADVVIRDGKTGPRTVPLIDSIPYVKEWIKSHPHGTNPEARLYVSKGKKTFGQKLTYDGLVNRYSNYYKRKIFPNLLKNHTVPEADKSLIKYLLLKPWNLYIFRHSSLTEKSQYLSESLLKDHAGWSMGSNMPQVYIHLKGESSRILLQKRGIIEKDDREIMNALLTKQCPNCLEPNQPNSKFCTKCKMVLKYDAYIETIEEKEQTNEVIANLADQIAKLTEDIEVLKNISHN